MDSVESCQSANSGICEQGRVNLIIFTVSSLLLLQLLRWYCVRVVIVGILMFYILLAYDLEYCQLFFSLEYFHLIVLHNMNLSWTYPLRYHTKVDVGDCSEPFFFLNKTDDHWFSYAKLYLTIIEKII